MSNYAIYRPKKKAAEFSEYACNFYVGCSNGCTYCYLKKGIGCKTLGGNTPTLKKCFKDENHALKVFEKELKANLLELQKHGLLFSFTTDPMLTETIELTRYAISKCFQYSVPVKILSKVAPVDSWFIDNIFIHAHKDYIAFGFTLTGHDELEPGASTNAERITAMKKLHDAGFKTWASIEPIIDLDSSMDMIADTRCFCDLYKIGLESGKKYRYGELISFIYWCCNNCYIYGGKVYFKDSLLKAADINRSELPVNCVNRDYNIFKD